MAQKRTDYSKFTQPNGTIQVLMLWASVALHLAIGSNLGLFGRLDPIKVKPAGGTVRVVDLTPAEQTRVPESAKSKPLPISKIPVNPEPATKAQVIPLQPQKPGVPIVVSPPPITPPFSVIRKQLPPPSVAPKPSPQSPKKEFPTTPKKRIDPQQDVTSASSQGGVGTGTGNGVGTGTGNGVGTGTGNGVGTGTGNGVGTGTGNGVGTGTGNGVGTGTGNGVGTGTGNGVGTGTGNGVGPGTGNGKSRDELKKDFDKNVSRLSKALKKIGTVESKYTKLPRRDFRKNRTCSSREDGYIFIAIILDWNGKTFQDEEFELRNLLNSNLIDGDQPWAFHYSSSLKTIVDDRLDAAIKQAQKEYNDTPVTKRQEYKNKKIFTLHILDEVYGSETCQN
jgi:hypothetical protein